MDFERLERALFRASNRNTINRGLTLLKLGRRYAGADGQEHAARDMVATVWRMMKHKENEPNAARRRGRSLGRAVRYSNPFVWTFLHQRMDEPPGLL